MRRPSSATAGGRATLDRESGSLTFWGTIVPVALLVTGLLLTAGVAAYWDGQIEERHRERFDRHAAALPGAVEHEVEHHQAIVEGAAGLFEASENVTREEFHRYADARGIPSNGSPMVGLAYAQVVDDANLSATLDELSRQHGEQVTLTPDAERERYAVLAYAATHDVHREPVGTELHASPARADAMAATLAEGEPRLSTLLDADGDAARVELFVPVFEGDATPSTTAERDRALQGWVVGLLDPTALAGAALGDRLAHTSAQLTLRDHDGQPWQVASLPPGHAEDRGPIPLEETAVVPALGQSWFLETHTLAGYVPADQAREPWIVAGVGATGTLLVAGLALVLSRSEARARERADEARAHLKKEHAAVELLQDVAVATHETDDPEEAFQVALERVCASSEWEAGHVLEVDREAGVVRSTDQWHVEEDVDVAPLVAASRGFELPVGDPIAGHVAEHDDPILLPDIREIQGELHRFDAARRAGVRGAFAFPVHDGDEVVAVLEFFDLDVATPDEDTLEVMESVGTQLGRVVERTRAREAVEDARARMQAVLESLDSAFTALDEDWRFTYLNGPAAETLPEGVGREEALGRRIWDLFPELEGTEAEDELRAAMRTREPRVFEEHDPETDRWWETRVFPFEDGITVFQDDITDRKRRQRALERHRRNLELAEEVAGLGHWTWDLATDEIEWSPGAYEVFGRDPDSFEVSFEGFVECLHPDDRERVQEEVQAAVEAGEAFGSEYRVVHGDGEVRQIHAEGVLETDDAGEPVAMLGTVQDVTRRVEREQELREAKRAAEAASEAKSAFLANTSHEIRTPMNAVLGMTSLLQDTELTTEQRDFVETVRASGEHLLTLINDILDLSKIEAGRMDLEPQPFRLRGVVEEALDIAAQRASSKPVDVAYVLHEGVPEGVETDPGRLRQVLVNLLGNAVKFTDEGEVRLDVRLEAREGDEVDLRFEVHDTGIGISEEDREELFQAFTQADTGPDRRYQGTGLGLSISKQLTELMGGTIDVESEPGVGSTFTFTVHAREADVEAEDPTERDPGDLQGLRVLVVDDLATNREILEGYLEAWAMEPVLVEDPQEALERVAEGEEFDLALIDYMMPDMDGLELASRIREHRSPDELAVLLLTSSVPDDDTVEAAGASLSGTLTKPIKPSTLFDQLLATVAGREPVEDQADEHDIDRELGARLPLSILVAEDNPVSQKVADAMLERMGYDPDIVGSGKEALQALDVVPYDVVFLDIQMPGLDGFETARRIRKSDDEHQPRIVAMTAHATDEARDEAREAGMDDYVPKPVEIDDLERALKRAVDAGED